MNKPKITAIFDYIVELSGEYNYTQNQLFSIKKSSINNLMLVVSATVDKAYCLTNGKLDEYYIGNEVFEVKESNLIKTSEQFFGKIISINGEVIFPEYKEKLTYLDSESEIFNKPNDLLEYQPLTEQLNTGYMSVDLLIPIGKGQRELIIGDRKTGKTFLALNTIINQKFKNIKCIYVGIGKQHSQIASVYQTLKDNNALNYTIIVNAEGNNPYDQYLAPYVAMAHAENLSKTHDVLIVFDDLTNHANIFREIALLTNKPVGKEAFPGDTFFAHSRLLERAGKFKNRKSITALPILQTIENDITSLIASNVISITDGQLVTNTELFANNKLPAIDIELSVSRIGGGVQKSYISKVASEIGKIYKLYKHQTKLSSLKYDLNEETNSLINNGILVENMFNQQGISIYSEKTMYLTSKLIAWNILKDVSDVPRALKFVDLLIELDPLAKQSFTNLINQRSNNETMIKNYFAFVLNEYAKFKKYDWSLPVEQDFVALTEEALTKIDNAIGGK
ncbi:ATP synthase F0F1 subunit alpha [Metamycoplasma cloacale]|uniref:ATP F0F1 synthase subunit alpha n=1 Tax=Metamycoplasma cloacale TaxID=92401 RepID=A0A2Z4LLE1_9BACT|nr:ATP F0F1 synthase subunit alpha [Metamycoplasma cloacale]AWX42579.1 ATP F0F1 synthase subunit alpha [Metamycoplasma cloacale]VEU79708.1 ATP synthase F0F1 subunit alpha [Metamycoplasma cloacale]